MVRPEVFLNCPFDVEYHPMYEAIVFTVMALGFQIRVAKEVEDSSQSRLAKIIEIIREAPLGIHDLSRVGLDPHTGVARFNMPLELGLFLGAKAFGARAQKAKVALILDTVRDRHRDTTSDLAGNDIQYHADDPEIAAIKVRDWLAANALGRRSLPGARMLIEHYRKFTDDFPKIRDRLGHYDNVPYRDFLIIIRDWLQAAPLPQATSPH
ncbi:hypothetical protein DKG75_16430 [Zavarzinia compransoris]|uniref:Uncharacterized protein n=2 Tax=Zavarzinia compransoris TaxID=1264899 RepID=A0A317E0Q2_9PROT|nr:hypothetical protein DKG75_16430 [Zavarzinia compransoris]